MRPPLTPEHLENSLICKKENLGPRITEDTALAKNYYLKMNVFMEPLVNQWYAWGNLIPPHCLAMTTANLQMKIMESYIRNPIMHANAVKNPKMLGGPFIDLQGNQTKKVQDLMSETQEREADLLELAEAVKALDTLLLTECKGASMVEIYQQIPKPLRGYVEVGYDLNNHPSIRFVERLLYRSPYYRESRQAIRVALAKSDHRAFVLSTPRFPDSEHLHFNIPYRSEVIDRLFSMKFNPAPLSQVEELIPENAAEREAFNQFFTEEAPQLRNAKRDDLSNQVRVRYYGHAVVLIESKDVSIMTDPCVSYSIQDATVPRYTYEDLPEVIDFVLLTHNHQDHILWETLLPLRHRIKTIVVPPSNGGTLQDPSIKLFLNATGFTNVIELEEMAQIEVPGGVITGIPFFGEHGELHIRSKTAYHINIGGKSVMCAADSNNLVPEIYDQVRRHLGETKTVFVGMECDGAPMSWLYGPLLTKPLERRHDQSRRLDGSNSERALQMLESLGAEQAFIYAMGQEPWLKFISSISYTAESTPIVEAKKVIDTLIAKGHHGELLFGKKEIYL